MKKILSLILCLSMLVGIAPVATAASGVPELYVMHDFNSSATNSKPENANVIGKNVKIVDKNGADKHLTMELLDGYAYFECDAADVEGDYAVSFDINIEGAFPDTTSVKILGSDGKTVNIFSFANGRAASYNGYPIDGVNLSKGSNITVICSPRLNSRSVYVDGKCRTKNLKIKSTDKITSPVKLEFEFVSEASADTVINLDNICVYGGGEYVNPKSFPKSAYNPDETMFVADVEPEYDYVYVSENFNTSSAIGTDAKSNKIERVTEDNNGYIKFSRISNTDLYANYMSLQIAEKRFVTEFDVKPISGPATVVLCLRDASSQNANAININMTSGAVTTVNGNKNIGSVSKTDWTTVSLVFNLYMNTFDFYINGDLRAQKCKLPDISSPWDSMNMIRWYVGTGSAAEFGLDNAKIYAGKEIRELGAESTSEKSILKYDRAAEVALKGSVSLHPDSDYIWAVDEKKPLEQKIYIDETGSLMIGIGDITGALGLEGTLDNNVYTSGDISVVCVQKNGAMYVNLDDFTTVFKINNEETERGLIVLNKYTSQLSTSLLEQMNDYLIYDHPTKEDIDAIITAKNLTHPYVLAPHERFVYLKENWQTVPELKTWGEAVLKEADRNLNLDAVTYDLVDDGQTKRLLSTSRKVYARAKNLGMAYWLTGDKKYSDRLYKELDAVMNFPDWHPGHYLDTAEMAMGFAIGYDWAYDAWTDEQKSKMQAKAFEYCLDGYSKKIYASREWDINSPTNRGIVNNAGPGVTALAFYDTNPVLYAELIENAIWGMDIPMRFFFPGGSWYEGPGYWSYTVDYLANFMSTVESVFDTDFGIYKAKGFSNTGNFAVYSSGAGVNKYVNNFHDTGYNTSGNTKSVVMLWLSSITNNPALQNICIKDRNNAAFSDASALVWCNLDAFSGSGSSEMPLDSYITGDEHISLRSSFDDTGATVLMAHGGVGDASHSHLEYGTYVIDMAGERWAVDMGSDNYGNHQLNSMQNGRYFSYRVSPAGHNTILFNPSEDYPGQDYDGFCEVTKLESKERGSFAILDMTSGYKRDTDKIMRGYMLTDDRRSVTIRDEATLKKDNSSGYWLCHLDTKEVEIVDSNTAILTKNGKKVKFAIATNAESYALTFDEADYIEGFKNTKSDLEYSRDMFRRLTFKFEGAPKNLWIQAKFISLSDPASEIPMELTELSSWQIPDGELRTIPALSGVKVEGYPDFKFGPSETYYNIKCDDISNPPAIEVFADESIAVKREQMSESVLQISASRDGLTTRYTFEFSVPESLPDINGMKRYSVYAVEASETPEVQNPPEHLADGDIKTKWAASGAEQWATIDLGSVRQVDVLGISFLNGERIYTFDILVSNDNETWETVYNKTTSSGTADIMEFLDMNKTCRYIRFVGHSSNVNAWNNPSEIAALVRK